MNLALNGKRVPNAANVTSWKFAVDFDYPEFQRWLRFNLGGTRELIREWGVARGGEATENLIEAIETTMAHQG